MCCHAVRAAGAGSTCVEVSLYSSVLLSCHAAPLSGVRAGGGGRGLRLTNKAQISPPQDARNYEVVLFWPVFLLRWGVACGPAKTHKLLSIQSVIAVLQLS